MFNLISCNSKINGDNNPSSGEYSSNTIQSNIKESNTTTSESNALNSSSTDNNSISQQQQLNNALHIIPEGNKMLDTNDQNIFLLKSYEYDMKWMEVNQIKNLDRGTELTTNQEYFLLIPKYSGTKIEVNEVEWDNNTMSLIPTKTLYTNNATLDDYGLILTSIEPDGIPSLSVTVTYEDKQYTYYFQADGKGDRPKTQYYPEHQN